MNKTITSHGSRNEELFLAGVEYLSKKYRIDSYTLATKNTYHVEADSEAELDMKKELIKIFQK
jgi:hypothetical protein